MDRINPVLGFAEHMREVQDLDFSLYDLWNQDFDDIVLKKKPADIVHDTMFDDYSSFIEGMRAWSGSTNEFIEQVVKTDRTRYWYGVGIGGREATDIVSKIKCPFWRWKYAVMRLNGPKDSNTAIAYLDHDMFITTFCAYTRLLHWPLLRKIKSDVWRVVMYYAFNKAVPGVLIGIGSEGMDIKNTCDAAVSFSRENMLGQVGKPNRSFPNALSIATGTMMSDLVRTVMAQDLRIMHNVMFTTPGAQTLKGC